MNQTVFSKAIYGMTPTDTSEGALDWLFECDSTDVENDSGDVNDSKKCGRYLKRSVSC